MELLPRKYSHDIRPLSSFKAFFHEIVNIYIDREALGDFWTNKVIDEQKQDQILDPWEKTIQVHLKRYFAIKKHKRPQ